MSIPPFKIENIDLNYMRQRQMSKSKSKEQQQQPTKTTDAKQWYSLSNDFDRDRFRKTCEEFVQNDKRILNRALDAEEEGDEMLVEAVKMVYKVESRRGLKEVLGRERKEAIIRHGLRYILTDDKKMEGLMEHYNLLVPSNDDEDDIDGEPQQQNEPVTTGITDEDASSTEDMYALLLSHGVDLGKSEESINCSLEKPESQRTGSPVKSNSQASSGEQSLDGDSPFFSYGEASSSNTGEDSSSGASSTTLDSESKTPSSCSSPQPQIHKTCIVAPGKTSAAGEPTTCAESSSENTDLSDIRYNQALAMANRRIKSPWISGFLLSSRTGQPLVSNYATRNETSPPEKSAEKENTETNNSSRPRSQSDSAYRKISMKDLNIKNSRSGNKAVVNTSTEVLGKGSVNDTSSNLPVVPEESNEQDDDRSSHGWDEEILDLPKSEEDLAKHYTMGPTQKLSRS